MNKAAILKEVGKRVFDVSDQNSLQELLQSQIHRIEFTTDVVGFRDVLFLAEKGSPTEVPVLFALDVECDTLAKYQDNVTALKKAACLQPGELVSRLERFFATTKRTLFVEIGFVECGLTEEDELKIVEGFRRGNYSVYEEGAKDFKRFPAWYAKGVVKEGSVSFLSRQMEKRWISCARVLEEKGLEEWIDELLDTKEEEGNHHLQMAVRQFRSLQVLKKENSE